MSQDFCWIEAIVLEDIQLEGPMLFRAVLDRRMEHGMTLHDVRICSDDQAMHVTCDQHEHGSSYGSFGV